MEAMNKKDVGWEVLHLEHRATKWGVDVTWDENEFKPEGLLGDLKMISDQADIVLEDCFKEEKTKKVVDKIKKDDILLI